MTAGHLLRRYWWALTARPLRSDTQTWVDSQLLDGERALFARMSASDQRHHVQVARRFVAECGGTAPRAWVAAALLHDVGKIVCGLGTHGRVVATLLPLTRGDGRIAQYHRHEGIGATLARLAGSEADTIALVGRWPGSPRVALDALFRADDV